MKSLFDPKTHSEILERLNTLTPNSQRLWGKMDSAKMIYHCQQPLKVALGEIEMKKQFFPLAFLFKKSLYNDKPWRQNLPTVKSFKTDEDKDFEIEKEVLTDLIASFNEKKNQTEWNPHPIFGKFTADQWGKMQYKHLDHHFRQFGA